MFQRHRLPPPCWQRFSEKYGHLLAGIPRAGDCIPPGPLLYKQAQRADDSSASSMDGWAPGDLKRLPPFAWTQRARLLRLCATKRRWPSSYYRLSSPALRKFDKMDPNANHQPPLPLDHRLISVYAALYRVESGAWYRNHIDWLLGWIPKECFGGFTLQRMLRICLGYAGSNGTCCHARPSVGHCPFRLLQIL